MSIDALPETQCHAHQLRAQQHPARQESAPSGWGKRSLLAIGAIVVVASAALIFGANSSQENDHKLTHTITRRDLTVAVNEQGILESAENVEIKCKVRGRSTVIWVIDGGTMVEPGDELVKLSTLAIEDAVSERTKYALWSRSAAERSRATVATAELAIPQYLEGTYSASLMTMEKDLALAESDLLTAQNMLDYATTMAERGYVSDLVVEASTFQVMRAELDTQVKKTAIEVLKDYTKEMTLQTRTGNLKAAKANLAASEKRAIMDATRRDLALDELQHCVIKAEKAGLVIHPSAAKWKTAPEIEEGATVHKDQVLMLMPDLSQMQVKVGIHEAIVKRIKPGQMAKVTLPDKTIEGEVTSVASVTRPASWWTGNEVKYDTIIELPSLKGLKPGMSADVEVITARHKNVLTIPVAAVVATAEGNFCWVQTAEEPERRSIELGDTNDSFTVVKAGLKEGDEVVLNPYSFKEDAQREIRIPRDKAKPSSETTKSKPTGAGTKSKPKADAKPKDAKPKDAEPVKTDRQVKAPKPGADT